MIEEFQNFNQSFKNGYNYVLYGSDEDNRIKPEVDYTNIRSVGFKLGFEYAEWCEITHQTMSVSPENMLAVIDKNFTIALKQMDEYKLKEKQYSEYKNGFTTGKDEVLLKFNQKDESYNIIPDLDITSAYSIGYYDGYCYFLRDILRIDGLDENITATELDMVCRESFNESYETYNLSNMTDDKKVK